MWNVHSATFGTWKNTEASLEIEPLMSLFNITQSLSSGFPKQNKFCVGAMIHSFTNSDSSLYSLIEGFSFLQAVHFYMAFYSVILGSKIPGTNVVQCQLVR